MGHKIFISYKYYDDSVCQHIDHQLFRDSFSQRALTPRDYVDVLAKYLDEHSPHYCKAEEDGNDLSDLSDDQIWEILKDKIYDSTLTIVLVSPNMREPYLEEKDQWIPWEIKYSLDQNVRHNVNGEPIKSSTNAMLAIVLPDRNGKYDYYFENKTCCSTGCRLNHIDKLFKIMKNNTFNYKGDDISENCRIGDKIWHGKYHSYIPFYKWEEINTKEKIEKAIELSYEIQSMRDKYNISHEI